MSAQTVIDFHVLATSSKPLAYQFACKQIEALYQANKMVYVHTENESDAARFDTLLWTFSEDSFIPHTLFEPGAAEAAPIQIGHVEKSPDAGDVLINLSTTIPKNFQQFKQVIEIVFADPNIQQLARVRFKHYRDQNHEITTHK